MSNIIISNIIALLASILMVCTGMAKTKKKTLSIQTTQIFLHTISNLIVGGITGTIINSLNIVRNVLCYKNKLNIIFKIILTILSIALSLSFNNIGIIGLLPLIASVSYIWLMNTKSIIKFKILIIFTMFLWLFYDITIKLYVTAIFDVATIIGTFISLYQIKKRE